MDKTYNILIDLSSLVFPSFFKHYKELNLKEEKDKTILKNIIFFKIKFIIKKAKINYKINRIIIAIDDKNSWRRDYFKQYKQSRRDYRKYSQIDFETFFIFFNDFIKILNKTNFIILNVKNAEADDVIAVLIKEFSNENFLLYGIDKDFKQLLFFNNVKFFNIKNLYNIHEEKCNNPILFLKEHIIRGDYIDGIPNVLSDDDCIVSGRKQKSITKKFLKYIINKNNEELLNYFDIIDKKNNYIRNKKLIDLIHDEIPKKIKEDIINKYEMNKNKKINILKLLKLLQKEKLFKIIEEYENIFF